MTIMYMFLLCNFFGNIKHRSPTELCNRVQLGNLFGKTKMPKFAKVPRNSVGRNFVWMTAWFEGIFVDMYQILKPPTRNT